MCTQMLKRGCCWNLQKQENICNPQFHLGPRAPDRCGKLQNSKASKWPSSISSDDICIQMCADVSSWQMVDTAACPSFMRSHEPGFCLLARYHRLWRVYHSYKPIHWQPVTTHCFGNKTIQWLPHLSEAADCETINYLTCQ